MFARSIADSKHTVSRLHILLLQLLLLLHATVSKAAENAAIMQTKSSYIAATCNACSIMISHAKRIYG